MKTRTKLVVPMLVAVMFVFGSLGTANAAFITWELTTDVGFSGEISIDETIAEATAAGDLDPFGRIFWGDFENNWEFAAGPVTFSPGTGQVFAGTATSNWVMVDENLDIIMWRICVVTGPAGSSCSPSLTPAFLYQQWDSPPFTSDSTFLNVLTGGGGIAALSSNDDRYAINGVWTRVPEPSTLLLFGIGLLALGFLHRRRKVTAT